MARCPSLFITKQILPLAAPLKTMSNQSENQNQSGSDALFCVGDAVTWMHTKYNGNSFNFSTRNGKIEEIGGFSASVKMRNGRRAWVLLSQLRKEGQRTELTEMFVGKESSQNTKDQERNASPASDCSPRKI